jgi:hypothetical protein
MIGSNDKHTAPSLIVADQQIDSFAFRSYNFHDGTNSYKDEVKMEELNYIQQSTSTYRTQYYIWHTLLGSRFSF